MEFTIHDPRYSTDQETVYALRHATIQIGTLGPAMDLANIEKLRYVIKNYRFY